MLSRPLGKINNYFWTGNVCKSLETSKYLFVENMWFNPWSPRRFKTHPLSTVNESFLPWYKITHAFSSTKRKIGINHCHTLEHYKNVWNLRNVMKTGQRQSEVEVTTYVTEANPQLVQFSSVAQSCPTLWDPMNRSTLGLPKAQYSENEDHGIRSHHFVGNRWGNSGNSFRPSAKPDKIILRLPLNQTFLFP